MAKKKEREKKSFSGVKFQLPQYRVNSVAAALFVIIAAPGLIVGIPRDYRYRIAGGGFTSLIRSYDCPPVGKGRGAAPREVLEACRAGTVFDHPYCRFRV